MQVSNDILYILPPIFLPSSFIYDINDVPSIIISIIIHKKYYILFAFVYFRSPFIQPKLASSEWAWAFPLLRLSLRATKKKRECSTFEVLPAQCDSSHLNYANVFMIKICLSAYLIAWVYSPPKHPSRLSVNGNLNKICRFVIVFCYWPRQNKVISKAIMPY